MAVSACHKIGLALVVLLFVGSSCFSGFVLYQLRLKEREFEHKNIHLIIDTNMVDSCTKPNITKVPCFAGPNAFQTREGNLGPLKCKDDYYDEEGGVNSCETVGDTFHLNSERNAIEVQKPGIYRIYGQVSFKDNINSPVVVVLRINDHHFVQCHQQNLQPSGNTGSVPYTTCTISGERRLREGNKVALYLPENLRTINSYHKTTFWGMVLMAN